MSRHNFTIQTRQKSDELVRTDETLAPLGIFESEVREIAGYSAVSILAKGAQSIQVRVEEACTADGTFGLTQTLASALDPSSGLYVVCERTVICGAFAKFYVDNLNAVASAAIDACVWGLPTSASAGIPGPAGPVGPAGPAGPTLDTRASTFVVGPDHADYPLTEAGLLAAVAAVAALAADGGEIYIREGTITLTAAVVLPDKNIKLVGAGQLSTLITLGANVITGFSTAFAKKVSFDGISILGGNIAGQIGISSSSTGTIELRNCAVGGPVAGTRIEIAFSSSSVPTFDLDNVDIGLRQVAAARTVSGSSIFRGRNVRQTGFGGFTSVDINLEQSSITVNNQLIASSCVLIDCFIIGAGPSDLLDVSGEAPRIIGCYLQTVHLVFSGVIGNAEGCVIGCTFASVAPAGVFIDLDAASTGIVISGNIFDTAGLASVRIANTSNVVSGNAHCTVTETGAANSNRYTGNTGFSGSVIIGPDSIVEGWRRKDATAVATVDGLTLVFSHHNEKALDGSGSIKNTGGANTLTVRRSVTDAYGTSATQDDDVLPGASLNWRVDEAIGTALPPYETFSVSVRSTVAGMSTTYSLRHASVGAE